MLLFALLGHQDAMVQRPIQERIEEYYKAIGEKYPVLKDVWGATLATIWQLRYSKQILQWMDGWQSKLKSLVEASWTLLV